ncbi:PREDICTED: protein TIC 40, chloroplastic [Tarenaya hassleriana]|uniref:protein TIC 40, chloroplastic n=1 Tax=Tarenaya hassleriana TaxID=28532 RepID=UPI00053C4880|nr:PREDICTED: protein TIC 40, chloroplastic [Tarenaya hassleriana]
MENLTIVSYSSSSPPELLMGCNFCTSSLKSPTGVFKGPGNSLRSSRIILSSRISASARSTTRLSRPAIWRDSGDIGRFPSTGKAKILVKHGGKSFASVSSSSGEQTTSVGYPNVAVPPSSSSIGSPLFWIGIGVGLSALFSWVTSSLKQRAMETAMKTMMSQMNKQSNQFNSPPFPTGSPFPFPIPTPTSPVPSPIPTSQFASQSSAATLDVTATKVDKPPSAKPETSIPCDTKEETKPKKEERDYAFVDVSPEETTKETPFSNYAEVTEASASKNTQMFEDVLKNGAASQPAASGPSGFQFPGTGKGGPGLSVEALEKMMEDPTVQKMVYPYLPEEMRNPETFKWMIQNPQYRQQLQDMLNNMSGSGEWDKKMTDTLKNFDLNSPEVKQQFDQIGMTPEEVISKIMANPDVAVAFQNPRVQAALMECSENPMNIMKYQNDKEVMDVFNKISQLFPGMTG